MLKSSIFPHNTPQDSSLLSRLLALCKNRIRHSVTQCLPSSCLLCGGDAPDVLCQPCKYHYFTHAQATTTQTRCPCCALPVATTHGLRCGECLRNPPAFDSSIVACDYIAPLDQLVLGLKFGHRPSVAATMAELLMHATINPDNAGTSSLIGAGQLPDILIPVPLSRQRLAERGYNQSQEIAKPLAKALSIPLYPHLLSRNRHTQAQATLHPDQRRQNLHQAFTLNSGYTDKIAGCHIGVTDDVMTTGATLHEIATCLKQHGASKVTNLVFARTPSP